MGLSDDGYLAEGLADYEKRLRRYCSYERLEIPNVKNAAALSKEELKIREGQLFMGKMSEGDQVVLLDEKGKMYGSTEFSEFLQARMNGGTKQLVFLIGGAYGFSDELHQRAQFKLSLSKMTLTHQMVRLFFTEQLYRAHTILKGEKYHHE